MNNYTTNEMHKKNRKNKSNYKSLYYPKTRNVRDEYKLNDKIGSEQCKSYYNKIFYDNPSTTLFYFLNTKEKHLIFFEI